MDIFKCSYCPNEYPLDRGRQYLRHLQHLHGNTLGHYFANLKLNLTKDLTHTYTINTTPKVNSLVCNVCKWTCDTTFDHFKRHVSLHSSGRFGHRERLLDVEVDRNQKPGNVEDYEVDKEESDRSRFQQKPKETDDEVVRNQKPGNVADYEVDNEEPDRSRFQQKPKEADHNAETGGIAGAADVATLQAEASQRFLLTLYAKGNTTRSQIQSVVEASQAFAETSAASLQRQFQQFVNMLPQASLDTPEINNQRQIMERALSETSNPFYRMDTERRRITEYIQQGLNMPVSYPLGHRSEAQKDGSMMLVNATAQYVPVIKTLARYIDYPTNAAFTAPFRPSRHDIFSYKDGELFKGSQFFADHPDALRLCLYNDDIELANPLGSKAGVHKLTMFYMTVHSDAAPSDLHSIHLVLVCYASDLKEYGYSKVLQPFIADLQRLNEGILIATGRTETVLRARLVQLIGDNLAANQILGMVASFQANYFCRFCVLPSSETRSALFQDSTRLRTSALHKEHLTLLVEDPNSYSQTGVKSHAALDDLSYFSALEASVPDTMHDLLEGIGKRQLRLILLALIESKVMTLAYLNNRIVELNYGSLDISNKPSVMTTLDGIKQTASQTWCLLRTLPFLIGHRIGVENVHWTLFLKLRDIMDMAFSPMLTIDATYALEAMIAEHHSSYLEIFPEERLTPKHHFLTHYGESIRRHGPLSSYWCMRYEGKHKFAKLVANVSCNFRNMPLTVTERFQLQDFALQRLTVTTGKTYASVGDTLCIAIQQSEPVFGRVTVVNGNKISVIKLEASYDYHMHAYQIEKVSTGPCHDLTLTDLRYQQAHSVFSDNDGAKYVCTRHILY